MLCGLSSFLASVPLSGCLTSPLGLYAPPLVSVLLSGSLSPFLWVSIPPRSHLLSVGLCPPLSGFLSPHLSGCLSSPPFCSPFMSEQSTNSFLPVSLFPQGSDFHVSMLNHKGGQTELRQDELHVG